jgi:hypothetical protein
MLVLTKTQWKVLNATADDYEDLEQIYKSICLEFSSDRYDPSDPNSFYWRAAADRVLLAEIADCIRSLVDQRLLTVRMTESGGPPSSYSDLSYVWKGWFQMTAQAREMAKLFATQFGE